MRVFLNNLIPKLSKFSKALDTVTVLTKYQWVKLDEAENVKVGYIFREKNNQLLISKNGVVEKANWEYLGDGTVLIESSETSLLLKQTFVHEVLLILQIDGTENTLVLVNSSFYGGDGGIRTFEEALIYLNSFLDNSFRTSESRKAEPLVEEELGTPVLDFDGDIRFSAVFKNLMSSQVIGIDIFGEIENPNLLNVKGVDIVVSFTKSDGEVVFRKIFPLSESDELTSRIVFTRRFDVSNAQWKIISSYTKPEFSFQKA